MKLKASTSRKLRYGGVTAVLTALIIAVVIVVNVIFSALSQKFLWYADLTPELLFTLSDPGERLAQQVQSNVFNRFMRQPGLGDSRFGLGLGLNIVHNTATAHGGTVLLENPPTGGVRITMTLKIRQNDKIFALKIKKLDCPP